MRLSARSSWRQAAPCECFLVRLLMSSVWAHTPWTVLIPRFELSVSGRDWPHEHAEVTLGSLVRIAFPAHWRLLCSGIASDRHVSALLRLGLANACVLLNALDEASRSPLVPVSIPLDTGVPCRCSPRGWRCRAVLHALSRWGKDDGRL
jgi:hypothetical protein